MAFLKRRCKLGERPCNELTVRGPEGGPRVLDDVKMNGSRLEWNSPRIILLIHGYHNDPDTARDSWQAFKSAMMGSLWLRSESALGSIWGFQWPGDHPNKLRSFLSYPSRPQDAREAGRLLAKHLAKHTSSKQEIFVVAHSLGCRVALETVKYIRLDHQPYAGATVKGIYLLAAAVPESFCDPLREPPVFARATTPTEHIFHSSRDHALGIAFDQGQRHYGEPGRAVGRLGAPARERWASRHYTGLGHGDYWSSSSVAEFVGASIGRPSAHRLPVSIGLQAHKFGQHNPFEPL